jgi:hypothetical protein
MVVSIFSVRLTKSTLRPLRVSKVLQRAAKAIDLPHDYGIFWSDKRQSLLEALALKLRSSALVSKELFASRFFLHIHLETSFCLCYET